MYEIEVNYPEGKTSENQKFRSSLVVSRISWYIKLEVWYTGETMVLKLDTATFFTSKALSKSPSLRLILILL